MKKYLKCIVVSFFAFLALNYLVSCKEKYYNPLPSYEYDYDLHDTIMCDSNMKIDGSLDEEEYVNQKYLSYKTSQGVIVNVTTYFSETGVYIGYDVKDSMIFYNKDFDMDMNSSVELFITNLDTDSLGQNVLQIRVDSKHQRRYTYFKAISSSKVIGKGVNSGESDGLTVEIYIPWSEIGLEAKPEKIKLMPAYNHITSYGADVATNWSRPIGNYNNPKTYYFFDSNGYENYDKTDVLAGDSATGVSKSNGWNLTNTNDGTFESCVDNFQMIFYKDAIGDKYQIETTIYPVKSLDDPLPKAGLMVGYNNQSKSGFLLDLRDDYVSSNKVCVKVIDFFSTWNSSEVLYTTYNLSYKDGIKLKVIKDNSTFYYYVNDFLCYINTIDYLVGEAMPGLITIGMDAKFTNLQYKKYESEQEIDREVSDDANKIKISSTIGGVVSSSCPATIKTLKPEMLLSQNVNFTIKPNNGYYISRATITKAGITTDWLSDLDSEMDLGNISVDVDQEISIDVEFKKISESNFGQSTLSGSIKCESNSIRPTNSKVYIYNVDSKTMYYNPTLRYNSTTKSATFSINLVKGNYKVIVSLADHITETKEINLNSSQAELDEISLKYRTIFKSEVEVSDISTNDLEYVKSTDTWDFLKEEDNIVKTSTTGNLYFGKIETNNYDLSVKICDAKSINSIDIKAGIIVAAYKESNELVRYCVMLDERSDSNKSYLAICKITSSKITWTNHTYIKTINITGEGNLLRVSRNGNEVKVYLDNVFVNSFELSSIENINYKAIVGLQTIGTSACFKDYMFN